MVEATPHSTNAHIQRSTKEGRTLTYCLSVIQQPERARACGAGAKSSADRRPVDPPPVVELRIYEGEGGPENGAQDITFSYNANFFLFATLEVARPMARGRVQTAAATQVPVLTGMPVSGMAYLDRPKEAGYFIFPDLSVRHEGKYCLSFNLYEETKEEKDSDAEPMKEESKPKVPAASGVSDSSFDWRLEVKSLPFTVYSAKKFPGLKESTVLSRTVAEQGCRVRIRRDVRMRRREDKGENYDEHAEEEYARVGRSVSQADHESYRQRSLSGSPIDPQRQPYTQERRNSGEYPPQPYQDYTPSPVTGHSVPQGGNLAFGPVNYGQQYQQPPPPPPSQYAQSQPQTQSQSMPPQQQYPPAQYHQAPYHQAPQYHQPPPPSTGPYGYAERQSYQPPSQPPQQSQPPQHQSYAPQREYEPEYNRRPSAVYATPPLPQGVQYPAVDVNYNRNPPSTSYRGYPPRPNSPPMPGHVNLAPLKMAPIEPKYQELTSPAGPPSSVNRFAPPLPSPSYDRAQDRPAQYGQYPAPIAAAEPPRNGKRSYENVFGSSTTEQPLYNGMRPNVHEQNYDDEDEMSLEQLKMQYKRADGTNYSRELPVLE